MKDKVREMQQQQANAQQPHEPYQQDAPKSSETRKEGDYIDFEEIK